MQTSSLCERDVMANPESSSAGRTCSQWAFITFEPEFWGLNEIRGGGGAIRPYELFTTLSRLGAECYVFETERNNPRVVEGVKVSSTLSNLPKVIDEVWKRIRTIHLFKELCRELTQRGRKICLWQKFPTVTYWKGGLIPVPARPFYLIPIAKQLGIYTWSSIHDLFPFYEKCITERMLKNKLKTGPSWKTRVSQYCEWRSLKIGMKADFVTTVSEEMRRAGFEGFARRGNALFRSGVRPALVEHLPTWPFPHSVWTIGYVGSYLDGALDVLVDAVLALRRSGKNVKLLVGTQQPDNLRSLVAQLGDDVQLQTVNYNDFSEIAKHVDLWVVPYDSDPYLHMTWQLKVPMYISSGRPVVMTRTPEVEHSGLDPYLFLTGTTSESMAETIGYVMSNPGAAKRKAEAGRAFVLREMTWEKIIKDLISELELSIAHTQDTSSAVS